MSLPLGNAQTSLQSDMNQTTPSGLSAHQLADVSARDHALSNSAPLRTALVVGCLIAVAIAAAVGRPQELLASDPDLAFLLRGMAVIKSGLVLAAAGVLLWRFGHPVSPRLASVYLISAWLGATASMLIWQLTFISWAAIAFHAGGLSFVAAAWFDRVTRASAHSH